MIEKPFHVMKACLATCVRHRWRCQRGGVFQPELAWSDTTKQTGLCSFCWVILPKLLLWNMFIFPCLPLEDKVSIWYISPLLGLKWESWGNSEPGFTGAERVSSCLLWVTENKQGLCLQTKHVQVLQNSWCHGWWISRGWRGLLGLQGDYIYIFSKI